MNTSAGPVAATPGRTSVPAATRQPRWRAEPGLQSVLGLWLLFAIVGLLIFVTYARLPVTEGTHAGRGGLAGGAIRTLLFLNFPIALAAIAIAGAVVARVLSGVTALAPSGRRTLGTVAALATGLCLVAAWPGVVPGDPVTVRPVNTLPVFGVVLVLVLTLVTGRLAGRDAPTMWTSGVLRRRWLPLLLLLSALPWLLADLGIFIGRVPLLGALFLSQQVSPGDTQPAVHLGHHHGLDGVLLAITALTLLPTLAVAGQGWLRRVLAGYLALMLAYGLTNGVQDFWLEQVVKRGWTTFAIPSVLWPGPTRAWGVLLVATVLLWIVLLRVIRHEPGQSPKEMAGMA